MVKLIYAIKISELVTSGLRVINVKIGQTSDINSRLRQIGIGNPGAEILDLWEVNTSINPTDCEKGIQMLAEKYAYKREKETFIFLQDAYNDFRDNVNMLLKNMTDTIEKKHKEKKRNQRDDYTGEKPELIKFCGKEYKVSTWREVLCKVAEEIYKEKKDFSPALKIKGRERIYFSKNKRNLVDPQEIKGSPYFCEGNLSANQIVKIVKTLLNKFGYKPDDLEIISK